MKSKAFILVVEDKSLIYKRMKMILKEHHYSVDTYTPSVEEAIANINRRRPDIVLLDIDLQGEYDGRYLGKLLSTKYNIPFIYVTDYDDDQTFYESIQTKPSDFVSKKDIKLNDVPTIIQTKPHLDEKFLLRAIQLQLEKNKNQSKSLIKNAIICYTDYIENTKHYSNEEVTQVVVPYQEIAFFTTNSDEVDIEKTEVSNKTEYKKMRINNVRVSTWDKISYTIHNSLASIVKVLPYNFVRISEDYIVNISDEILEGRINGKRLKIRDQVFTISDTYKAEVQKRFENLYQKM